MLVEIAGQRSAQTFALTRSWRSARAFDLPLAAPVPCGRVPAITCALP